MRRVQPPQSPSKVMRTSSSIVSVTGTPAAGDRPSRPRRRVTATPRSPVASIGSGVGSTGLPRGSATPTTSRFRVAGRNRADPAHAGREIHQRDASARLDLHALADVAVVEPIGGRETRTRLGHRLREQHRDDRRVVAVLVLPARIDADARRDREILPGGEHDRRELDDRATRPPAASTRCCRRSRASIADPCRRRCEAEAVAGRSRREATSAAGAAAGAVEIEPRERERAGIERLDVEAEGLRRRGRARHQPWPRLPRSADASTICVAIEARFGVALRDERGLDARVAGRSDLPALAATREVGRARQRALDRGRPGRPPPARAISASRHSRPASVSRRI